MTCANHFINVGLWLFYVLIKLKKIIDVCAFARNSAFCSVRIQGMKLSFSFRKSLRTGFFSTPMSLVHAPLRRNVRDDRGVLGVSNGIKTPTQK